MHRIDGAGHVDNMFVAEDLATNRPPTEFTPEWFNAAQEELASFIEWALGALDKGDNTQMRQGLLAKFALINSPNLTGIPTAPTADHGTNTPQLANTEFVQAAIATLVSRAEVQSQTFSAFTTAGVAPNFTLAPSPAITGYGAGQRFRVKFHADGTFGSDVLNVSALGNKSVKQYAPTGVKVPATIKNGQLADIEYDGVDLVILDPLPGGLQSILVGIGATTTLTAAHCGQSFIGGSSTAFALTLPLSTAVQSGSRLEFTNMNSGVMTVARQGADVINTGQSLTSVALNIGDTLTVESNGGGMWYVVSSGAGVAQSLQNVSASRVLGATYTNTSGRLSKVLMSVSCTTAGIITVQLGGTQVQAVTSGVGNYTSFFFEVPSGVTYGVVANSGVFALNGWFEIR